MYGKNEHAILSTAALTGKLDILKYLLIDKKAPIPDFVAIRQPGNKSKKKITISDLLNENDYTNEPGREKLKNEILKYLQALGKS